MKNQIVMCNTKIMTTQKAVRKILLEQKFACVGSFLIEKKRIHGRELHRNLCLRFQSCLQNSNHYSEYLLSKGNNEHELVNTENIPESEVNENAQVSRTVQHKNELPVQRKQSRDKPPSQWPTLP